MAFKLADYNRIVVIPLTSQGIKMPTDETVVPTRAVLAGATGPFTQGLASHLPRGSQMPVEIGTSSKGGPIPKGAAGRYARRSGASDPTEPRFTRGTLLGRVWRGRVAEATISGEVVDGRLVGTGKPLFRFTQKRRSGMGPGGGDYVEMMNRSLGEIGNDVAGVLAAAR